MSSEQKHPIERQSFFQQLRKKKKAMMRNRKPKDWREKRESRNKMAAASRAANRSR